MSPKVAKEVFLASRPEGVPQAEHFDFRTVEIPDLQDGELLIQMSHLSADPAMKGWVQASANYSQPVEIGEVMRAFAVGEVLASKTPDYQAGELVMGLFGWRDFAVVTQKSVWRKVTESDLPRTLALGVLGLTGLTAWAGVHRTLRPRPGDTLVVSSAAGAVGSIVGQLGAKHGCRTIGIAGGPEKAARCTAEFGFDTGLDYRSATFLEELAEVTPDGVDAYFDNTGGAISDAVVSRLTTHAAVMICGTAAVESWSPWPTGPRVERTLLTQRARMEGFLAFDHLDALGQATDELADMIREGDLTYREHILYGLDSAPGSINMLYSGENAGKLIISLD